MNIIYDKLKLNYSSTIHFNDSIDVGLRTSDLWVIHHEVLKQDIFCGG
jgi:hypothetical protein